MNIGKYYIKQVESPTRYAGDNKWKWFEGVLGALDGTHIQMTVPLEDRPRYRDRKGDISTNVLAVSNPNLQFTYVLPGWEGSASDPRILRDALQRTNGLKVMIRKGKETLPPTQGGRKRSYLTWNSQMDMILTTVFYKQLNQGNKGGGGLEASSLSSCC